MPHMCDVTDADISHLHDRLRTKEHDLQQLISETVPVDEYNRVQQEWSETSKRGRGTDSDTAGVVASAVELS